MSAPTNRWKLGLFVVAGFAVFVVALTWLGMTSLQRRTYTAIAFFDEPLVGLEEGSPVKFRGVPIGVVASITLAPDQKHLAVRASLFADQLASLGLEPGSLDDGGVLPPNLRAQVVTSFLTQKSFVLVDFLAATEERRQALPFPAPANTILTVPSTFRSVESGLRELVHDLPLLLQQTRELMQHTQEGLVGMDLPALGKRADELLASAERTLHRVESLQLVDAAARGVQSMTALADQWRAPDGPVQRLATDLGAAAGELREAIAAADVARTAESVREAGSGVGDAGREVRALTAELRAELPALRSALAAVERLASLLERDPGALLHGRSPATSPLREGR